MRPFRLVVLTSLLLAAASAFAANGSVLKPPAGASVALVVFEDLECPSCAQAAPLLEKASEVYKIPLVIHDYPNVRLHPWTMDATVMARYIEQKYGRAMSDKFRDYIFLCQPQITRGNLRSFTDRFCAEQKIDLPFSLDPQGKIAAAIRADQDLAMQVQLGETPTIFVISNSSWIEVHDRSQLYTTIDKMKRDATPVVAPKAAPKKGIKK